MKDFLKRQWYIAQYECDKGDKPKGSGGGTVVGLIMLAALIYLVSSQTAKRLIRVEERLTVIEEKLK